MYSPGRTESRGGPPPQGRPRGGLGTRAQGLGREGGACVGRKARGKGAKEGWKKGGAQTPQPASLLRRGQSVTLGRENAAPQMQGGKEGQGPPGGAEEGARQGQGFGASPCPQECAVYVLEGGVGGVIRLTCEGGAQRRRRKRVEGVRLAELDWGGKKAPRVAAETSGHHLGGLAPWAQRQTEGALGWAGSGERWLGAWGGWEAARSGARGARA